MHTAKQLDLIAVMGGEEESVPLAGAIVGWSRSRLVRCTDLAKALLSEDIDEEMLPEPPSEETALRRATKNLGRGFTSRSLSDGGWTIKAVRDTEDAHGPDVDFATELRVWKEKDGSLRFEPEDHDLIPTVQAAFVKYQQYFATNDISKWLTGLIFSDRIDGTGVIREDDGGVYFIPAKSLALWNQIKSALHACGARRIGQVHAMAQDSDAMATVLDGISAEVESALAQWQEDLAKQGKEALGKTALSNRKDWLFWLEEKVGRYEGMLGQKLEELRGGLTKIDEQIGMALIAAQAAKEEEEARRAG